MADSCDQGHFCQSFLPFLISHIGRIFRNVLYYYSSVQYITMQLIHILSFSLFTCSLTHNITDSFILLSLIESQLLSISPFLNPSFPLLHPSSPPCHQSEGTGSIVIGLQSWQPYDWAVGYCNWIRLEISSVPVRLLKSQSVVHSWRQPFALFFFVTVNGSHSQLLSESEGVTLWDCESDMYEV